MSDMSQLLEQLRHEPLRTLEPFEQDIFCARLQLFMADVERPLQKLYGQREDYLKWRNYFVEIAARSYAQRGTDLRQLDLLRLADPDWFQQASMVGYVAYTDRFAGTLQGVGERIEYLKELGVTYFHLMPLLKPRPGANDGGYAVMDYRAVREELGSMADLAVLSRHLRENGISLCIDLVCNHTAKEHEWAQKARAGSTVYQDYYFMFPDREMPDRYEQTVREIFPEFKQGSFTYYEDMDRWVWTTFNEFQWDLNYANPAVFAEMLDIMLYLANQGVEVLRLDAVAFMWKRLGTDCENQPEAHYLLQAWRALSRIAAPGLLLKAEAIVPPPQLVPYLGQGEATNKECEVAYHNVLMVMLWSSLAERKVELMTHALQQMPPVPSRTSWLTYVRCHDDIGWAVTEEDAAAVGLSGFLHRSFLSDFYSGRFPGTFARGETFQFNPRTNDRRISGSCASLAGLETARDQEAVDRAIRRILLIHSMILAFGGIPLLYMGDEIGLLNDYSYAEDPDMASDNRWLHRPTMDWARAAERVDWTTVSGRIFQSMQRLIEVRKGTTAFSAQAASYPVWTDNNHVFGLLRSSPRGRILVLGNFSEQSQTVRRGRILEMGLTGRVKDLQTAQQWDEWMDVYLEPYQSVWLASD